MSAGGEGRWPPVAQIDRVSLGHVRTRIAPTVTMARTTPAIVAFIPRTSALPSIVVRATMAKTAATMSGRPIDMIPKIPSERSRVILAEANRTQVPPHERREGEPDRRHADRGRV